MDLSTILSMEDRYSALLELSVLLADKAVRVGEDELSAPEAAVRLAAWVDSQVCNGGWEQWMYNTSVLGLTDSLQALPEVGCVALERLARGAVDVTRIDLERSSDAQKDERLD